MSGLEVVGGIASIAQLAGVVYTISKTLYEVGNALSNAGADIKDLASDLETFSDELYVYHRVLKEKDGRYLDEIYRITANVIGKCATICGKIDNILRTLRSGSVLARVKWLYKEKEVLKLLGRLRDLKISLMGMLQMLSGLKLDYLLNSLHVAKPSLVEGSHDEKLSAKTLESVEETRRKLEGISVENPRTDFTTGNDSNLDVRSIHIRLDKRSVKEGSPRMQQASQTLSATMNPGVILMQNPVAMESVQSFHSALSTQQDDEHISENAALGPEFANNDESTRDLPQQTWRTEMIESAKRHFNISQQEAESWAMSLPIPSAQHIHELPPLGIYSPNRIIEYEQDSLFASAPTSTAFTTLPPPSPNHESPEHSEYEMDEDTDDDDPLARLFPKEVQIERHQENNPLFSENAAKLEEKRNAGKRGRFKQTARKTTQTPEIVPSEMIGRGRGGSRSRGRGRGKARPETYTDTSRTSNLPPTGRPLSPVPDDFTAISKKKKKKRVSDLDIPARTSKRVARRGETPLPKSVSLESTRSSTETADFPTPDQLAQLWWRAFERLRNEDPSNSVGLQGVWDLKTTSGLRASLPRNLKDDEVASLAAEQLLEVLSPMASESNSSLSRASIIGIRDILNVVKDTMKFKIGPFAWSCFCIATKNFLASKSEEAIKKRDNTLAGLAEIASLIARYNVMESMYQQWEGMSLDKDYEQSIIALCMHVLKYLSRVMNLTAPPMARKTNDLEMILAQINEADAACRGFKVTIEGTSQQLIAEVSDESDADVSGSKGGI